MPKASKTSPRGSGLFFKVVPVTIFVLAALVYLFVPYEILSGMGLAFRSTEADKPIFGVVFLAMAGAFWFIQSRKKN